MPEPARHTGIAMVAAVIQTVAALCLPPDCLTDLTPKGRVQPHYQHHFVEYLEKAREASGQPGLKLKVGVAYHDLVKKRINDGGSSAYFREGYEKDIHSLPMGGVSVTSVVSSRHLSAPSTMRPGPWTWASTRPRAAGAAANHTYMYTVRGSGPYLTDPVQRPGRAGL